MIKGDYEQIAPECQYQAGLNNCSEPATHIWWWEDYDDHMPVCEMHHRVVLEAESDE